MIKPPLFLLLLAFSAACITTQVTEVAAKDYDYIDCSNCDDGNACTVDYCHGKDGSSGCSHENIVCHRSEKLCADGYLSTCDNYCDDGTCTTCEPLCREHECKEIKKQCSDGKLAACKEEYINNSCIPCEPKCICAPKYSCTDWGDCINGFHTRVCVDVNRCAPDKKETKGCTAIIKEDIPTQTTQPPQQTQAINVLFIEIMYDPSGEETSEEYIILSGSGDISSWTISDNSGTLSFPDGTVINGKLIIARNADFSSVYGCQPHIADFGTMRGLNNDGDQLTLKDSNGQERDFVAWEKGANNAYPDWTIAAKEGSVLRKNSEWHEAQPSPCS